LSDGNWWRTTSLGHAAGQYIRPEIAWRAGHGNINEGQRVIVNNKLGQWKRLGRVEKRRKGRFVEWRLSNNGWALPYLKALIEILKEQTENHSGLPVRKSRVLERAEREEQILRLHKQGLSQHQIAERLGCSQFIVNCVLKAAAADIPTDLYKSLPLVHRVAIAAAPREKQPEIARMVADNKLTMATIKKLVGKVR